MIGGDIIGGDAWMLKADSNGVQEWTYITGGGTWGEFKSSQKTSDGNYIGVGQLNNQALLVKTDNLGSQIFRKFYGLANSVANSGQETTDGGFILAGYTDAAGAGGRDYYLIKTDVNGNQQWAQTYGGAADDSGQYVHQIPGDGYMFVGTSKSYGGTDKVLLIKTDSAGNQLWTKVYGTGGDQANSITPKADGGFIIAGKTAANNAWILSIGPNGECTGYGCP
jgi:hypothetical protein